MSLIDYLLYDNRTEVRWGCDWGLKAATGALSSRADIKKNFLAYCGLSSNSTASPLSGFGHAIGGFPDGKGGYILCVTLENQDLVGRDSFSIIGLWFPAAKDLAAFLDTYGPLETARLVLDADSSRQGLLACGLAKPWVGELPLWMDCIPSVKPFIVPFDSNSANHVLEYMRRKAHKNRCPGTIFGVTSLFQLRGFTSFDIVYCFPGSMAAKLSLQDHLTKREHMGKTPTKSKPLNLDEQPGVTEPGIRPFLIVGALLSLILILLAFYIFLRPKQVIVNPDEVKAPTNDLIVVKKPPATQDPSDSEKFISKVRELVVAFQKLDPEDLEQSRTFHILANVSIEREPKIQEDAKKIITGLKAIHKDLLDMNGKSNTYIAGFIEEKMIADHGSETLAAEIARVMENLELNSEYCRLLEDEFKFEASDPNTQLGQWCKRIAELAELKKQSQKFTAHQK